ncbi:hypothetical protein P171DRAFT_478670 [Karstenula rhodostoma CBS 690.94]|uniref:Uncharacterized protein n=1 Tax=Karstenula rhodostoma CBS 690.94 TaxID=1392251 RepID=A0A9P4PYH1_9PLEO|nr:hypothetical protein P171DRAFT_478670 [Karstenula rhodostoma CBS 690.94]
MSNLSLRLPSFTTIGITALVSTFTIMLFYKQQQSHTQDLVAALDRHHADEKHTLSARLINEKHLIHLQLIELQRALGIAEASLATQTQISQIHEARVHNYEGAQQSSARLLEAGQETVSKYEDVVHAAEEQIGVLEGRLEEVREENKRVRREAEMQAEWMLEGGW